MRNISSIVLITIIFSFYCCKNDNPDEVKATHISTPTIISTQCPKFILNQKDNNLNISILLDLSDRIEKDKIQEKDSAYLSILSRSFVEHIKHKTLILLEDRMQLFFCPEPSSKKINEIAEKLKVVFTKNTSKAKINETLSLYNDMPSELYELAKDDAEKSGGYPGSDIWRFFKYNITDYAIDECHRNILVILTDGYMFHENTVMKNKNRTSYLTPKSLKKLGLNSGDWKDQIKKKNLGFIPANSNLNDLEVLVIGITSHNETPYAQDIIELYWKKWFDEMGIKKYKIKTADIPSSIEKVITNFILKT